MKRDIQIAPAHRHLPIAPPIFTYTHTHTHTFIGDAQYPDCPAHDHVRAGYIKYGGTRYSLCSPATLFFTCKPVFFWYTCFAKHARLSSNVCLCLCLCLACMCVCARVRACVCMCACIIALQHRAHHDLDIEGFLPLGLIQLTTTNLFVGKLGLNIEGPSATPS